MRVSLCTTSLSALTLLALAALLPYLPSSRSSASFTTTLMYTQAAAVFFGNLLAMADSSLAAHPRLLLALALARAPFLLVFLSAALRWTPSYDLACFLALILFAASGSFLNAASYKLLGSSTPARDRTRAVRWLNIALYLSYDIGALLALVLAFAA
eukprot:TRINITY_DN16229_c0_g1_i1.p1 TRINITY_DN16229_c0_g1~~TRINITY_DN16229_c0_g1_i1.p1  ORF type:complete len:156 (-),score=62.27 TRINITY_DN16229_c0_g1_i1:31-498(-)